MQMQMKEDFPFGSTHKTVNLQSLLWQMVLLFPTAFFPGRGRYSPTLATRPAESSAKFQCLYEEPLPGSASIPFFSVPRATCSEQGLRTGLDPGETTSKSERQPT